MTLAGAGGTAPPGRSYVALLIVSLCYAGVVIAGEFATGSWNWGINLLAYLSPIPRWTVLTFLVTGAGLLAWGTVVHRPVVRGEDVSPHRGPGRLLASVSLAAMAMWLWAMRDRSHLLGDGLIWIDNILAGRHPLYSEPLAAASWYWFASLSRFLGIPLSMPWLSVLPVLCGLVAIVLYWGISTEFCRGWGARVISVLLLLTLGSTQLFCGYIESYPIVAVAILLYLLVLVRRANRPVPTVFVGIVLSVAISSHLIALYLFPSYALLVMRERLSAWRAVLLAILPLALGTAILAALGYRWNDAIEPLHLVAGATGGRMGGSNSTVSMILGRSTDLLNMWLLVFPVPVLLLATRVATPRVPRTVFDSKTVLLVVAAIPGLIGAILLGFFVSPAHDWDLLTVALFPSAILIVGLAAPHLAATSLPQRSGVILIAVATLLSFTLVNANEWSAEKRYGALLAPDMRLTQHERAYGNERLMMTYTRHADYASALKFAKRSLAADPNNPRYWGNVGTALYNLKRFEESLPYHEEAARRDTTRADAPYNVALAMMQLGRFADAVTPLRQSIARGGETPAKLFYLGLALILRGDIAEGRKVWDRVLTRWPDDARTAEAYDHFFAKSRSK